MSTYSENFDTLVVGSKPAGWTNVGGNYQVTTTAPLSAPNACKDVSNTNGAVAFFNHVANVTGPKVNIGVRYDQTVVVGGGEALYNCVIRSDLADQNGYLIDLGTSGSIILKKKVNGAYFTVATQTGVTPALTNGLQLSVRVEIQNATIKVKIWTYNTSEPGSPQATFNDGTFVLPGYVGVRTIIGGGDTVSSIDNLSIYDLAYKALPSDVSWYDANVTSSLFTTSAMSTNVSANNDPVGAWVDQSTNGVNLTCLNANRGSYLTDSFPMQGGAAIPAVYFSSQITQLLGTLSFNTNNFTVLAAVINQPAGTVFATNMGVFAPTGAATFFNVYISQQGGIAYYDGTANQGPYFAQGPTITGIIVDPTAGQTMYQYTRSSNNPTPTASNPATGFVIGQTAAGGGNSQGLLKAISVLIICPRALTANEYNDVSVWLRNKVELPPDSRNLIILDGNSITSSSNAATYADGYPYRFWQDVNTGLSGNDRFQVRDVSWPGAFTTEITATQGQRYSQFLGNTIRTIEAVYYWEITNEVALGGVSGPTAYASCIDYYAKARAIGATRILAGTMLPRQALSSVETARISCNNSMRTLPATVCDILVDYGNNPVMGQPGDQNNTTYYGGDQIHPNSTGHGVLLGMLDTAFAPIAAFQPGVLTIGATSSTTIAMTWTAASGAGGSITYQAQRSLDGFTGWANTSGGTSSPFTNTGLTPNTTYYYRIACTDSAQPGSPVYTAVKSGSTAVVNPPTTAPVVTVAYVLGVPTYTFTTPATATAVTIQRVVGGITTTITTSGTSPFQDLGYTGATPSAYIFFGTNSGGAGPSTTVGLGSGSGAGIWWW